MDGGTPDKLLFGKRAAAALAYVGLASYDRVSMAVLQGRAARRFPPVRGTGRVFQVLADLSGVKPHTGPTDLAAACRHYAAQITQRGPLILISDLFDAERRAGDQRARRHALRRGGAPHALVRTSSIRRSRATCAWSTARRATASTSPPTCSRSMPTARDSPPGRPRLDDGRTKRRVAYLPTPTTLPLADLVFAELRRRQRRGGLSAAAGSHGLPRAAGADRAAPVPIIVAFYMLRLRRRERTVSSTFLWQQLVRDVEANAPWQRLRRSLLLLLQLLLAIALRVPGGAAVHGASGRPGARPGAGRSTRRPRCPPPTSSRTG